jgi:hypothetical protein
VADALEYAHEAGVLHRDIKPANLLLDSIGKVWVTDFGLAQVAAGSGLTQTGDVFGTLRYMSPEQALGQRLEVDRRSDVYSLGATFYELFTLQPIFPGEDRGTLLHQVLNAEPIRPRLIDPGVPPDLETIVLKALAKTREDRYATAGEMAADLHRFLVDQPILARRPSLLDRGRKWLRRHPAYVAAALLVLGFGVIALAVSTALVLREQRRAEAAYLGEKERAAEAEARFQLARRSADEMIRIADEELTDGPEQQTLRRRLLEAALAYYQEFIKLRSDDPEAQAELEAVRTRVTTILADLAVMQGAFRHMLLGNPAVREDLKLSTDQLDRLQSMLGKVLGHGPPTFRDIPRLSREERSKVLLREMKEHEAAIAEVLTPAQFTRLGQIALQVRGPRAMREPEVVAALGLTAEQREQIRGLDGPPGPPPMARGGNKPDPGAGMRAVLDLLTPEQRARWRELTGAPFSGANGGFPRGPFRPGGPKGEGQGFRDRE